VSNFNTTISGDISMKLKNAIALTLTSLAMFAPLAAHAQHDSEFARAEYMKMADKNGMISKADFMKMAEKNFDAMSKNGMMSMDDMGRFTRMMYMGQERANKDKGAAQ
jgi:hypothetical protein